MRVVLVAPPYYEIPPRGYGGTELICYLLAEGLVDRGHDVTVVGTGPRHTRARFIATFPEPQPEGGPAAAGIEARHAALAAAAIRRIGPDLVHVHTTGLPDLPGRMPAVLTVHSAVRGPDATSARLDELARRAALVAISRAQAASAPRAGWAAVVPNGIDLSRYPVGRERENLVVYLGRISPHKGTRLAIDAARAAGRPLVIGGGGTIPAERAYLDAEIMPCLGPDVRWLGELDFDRKVRLLGRAACLVFPARWDEPFGLVLVEAMACGTPVAALAAGAVPELVADGETGILCREPAGLGAAIGLAARLDPARCRARAERLFSAGRMVTDYENVYRRLISAPGSRPPGAGTGPARSG
jgi:glycosyltransferase involved in cell wall biosynthesis